MDYGADVIQTAWQWNCLVNDPEAFDEFLKFNAMNIIILEVN